MCQNTAVNDGALFCSFIILPASEYAAVSRIEILSAASLYFLTSLNRKKTYVSQSCFVLAEHPETCSLSPGQGGNGENVGRIRRTSTVPLRVASSALGPNIILWALLRLNKEECTTRGASPASVIPTTPSYTWHEQLFTSHSRFANAMPTRTVEICTRRFSRLMSRKTH